jgi:nucleoid-associated protein YgaU
MGNDVKIGLVVGAVVLLVVVGYFSYKATRPADSAARQAQATDAGSEHGTPRVNVREDGPRAIGQAPRSASHRPPRPDRPATPPAAPAAFASSRPMRRPGPPASAMADSGDTTPVGAKAPSDGAPQPADDLPIVAPPLTPIAVAPMPMPARAAAVPTSYTVKEDDSFWTISQAVYKDGKYHDLIAAANPAAKERQLRAGQILVIPPLPAEDKPAVAVAASSDKLPAGYREYVVAEEDKGFWAIAKKEYGSGVYWPLIQQANRKLDSDHLPVGQKVLIPPLSTPRKAVAVAPGAPGARPSVVPTALKAPAGPPSPASIAGKPYTVKDGDNFWKIAEEVFGDGKYMEVIRGANPGVDPNKLKIGQKLNIPQLDTSDKKIVSVVAPPPARKANAPEVASSGGKPIFD